MKQLSQQQASALLDRYMDGLTTLEEEAALRRYFRDHDDIPDEWQDYKVMFTYLDSGMEDGTLPVPAQEAQRVSLIQQMGRRWWGIAAAAVITAAVVVTATLRLMPSSTLPEQPAVTAKVDIDTVSIPPTVETEPQQLASATPASPVGRGSASATRPVNPATRTRRLQAENAKLAQENKRLQRELADLKRRAFIIDLEANGFRAVQDEDGSIVLIDLEQELENELNNHLNNQPTTNIPAL